MNFFELQDRARHSTAMLVVLFSLAVFTLIVLANLLVMVAFGHVNTQQLTLETFQRQFDWHTFLKIGLGVLAIVAFGSLYKIYSLNGSGEKVAELMGGALIIDGSGDTSRQRVLNVVEEMAIASGTPVPPVYLLHEDGINAFAAGDSPSNAVIGITRGAIEKLSRDELQGVIAHEFSHILNGDMKLNIQLIGILHGIMILGLIGYYLLRTGGRSRSTRNGAGVVALALGLVVIGYGGTFFGNLIKASVNRQREYLADASAVQFTRNPNGISGALKRIGSDALGSALQNPNGAEISHALFGDGIRHTFTGLFATHPPLEKRIRQIEPDWDGKFDVQPIAALQEVERLPAQAARHKAAGWMAGGAFVGRIGRLNDAQVNYAHQVLSELPAEIKQAARDPFAARALIYFMVLDNAPAMRQQQLRHLAAAADDGVYAETVKLTEKFAKLKLAYRLPALDIALSTLRQLSKRQYLLFKKNLDALVAMDARIRLFEWTLQKIVVHHLDIAFEEKKQLSGQLKLSQVQQACALVLSLLVHAGKPQAVSKEHAFAVAREKLAGLDVVLLPAGELKLDRVGEALDQLAQLAPLTKPLLLKACAKAIAADGQVSIAEAELFRAIADLIDCPMPPLVC
ncbi:Peptidase family M48 [Nitrosomonas sp. Nm51]|uniref:M48 family metallopeptidase n=1 Tax=Nitrosomonas sp. Nm51 TaxID=133720 RepID=UPI0008BC3FAB|nr:M48 family metallopeptidase [Nitrosomonas sp. Nm51]SER52429.1 Peptidase family M48 [Nitrosomonas sp. Nm51]